MQTMRDNPKNDYTIAEYCEAFEVSESGFYRWRKRTPSPREIEDARILDAIQEIHAHRHTRCYGSPRMVCELKGRGFACGENRVARIMREAGLRGAARRPFRPATTKQEGAVAPTPNLLKHVEPTAPGQVLAGDITYVATREGWLYLAVVIDLFGRRIPGWKLADDLSTPLVSTAVEKAARRYPFAEEAFFHSDRGCQYTSAEFGTVCSQLGLSQSLSRTGNCWDNAWSESFFASLKSECFPKNGVFESKALARRTIFDYIESFYNRSRLHSSLGYLSPDDYVARHYQNPKLN